MTKKLNPAVVLILLLGFSHVVFSATFTVSKTADTNDGICDSDCSLREAIAAAIGAATNDEIVFDSGVFNTPQTITLASELVISPNGTLAIHGPGADLLTLDGNNATRILFNGTGAVTIITGFTFTRGNGVGAVNTGRGGAIYNNASSLKVFDSVITGNNAANGGGANAAGSATTEYDGCVFSNNTSTGAGGALQNFSGNTLRIVNLSIYQNTANSTITGGGGAQLNGTVEIANTTVSFNTAVDSGGGFYYNGQGLTMNNVTIANNTSANDGGGIHKATSNLNAFLRNTILADNNGTAASTDITGTFNSLGNNLIETVGTSTGWVAQDFINQNALLSPLGFYGYEIVPDTIQPGGYTNVLLSNSPGIDNGNDCVLTSICSANNPPFNLTNDNRGFNRSNSGAFSDIGSTEKLDLTMLRGAVNGPANMPAGEVGVPYTQVITPDAGSFSYSVTGGDLPPGVDLNAIIPLSGKLSSTGYEISGVPVADGTFDFTITVSDGVNTADIDYRLVVNGMAAAVTVGGRVFDTGGNPAHRIYLTISDGGGVIQSTFSNSFGYFRFYGITAGQTYTINAGSKQYQFAPEMVAVNGEISNLSIMATSLNFYRNNRSSNDKD